MGNNYKRKRISNLDNLDLEEAKIKKKLKKIEQEWAEILDPQQLAIGFLTNFISKKIAGKKTSNQRKNTNLSQKENLASERVVFSQEGKTKKSGLKKFLKIAGLSVVAIFIVRKIVQHKKKPKQFSNTPKN